MSHGPQVSPLFPLLLPLLLVFAPAGCGGRVTPNAAAAAADAATLRAVDSLLADYARPGAPGAAVLVVKDGRVVVERGYGLADLEAGVAVTPRTNFRLASLTKQFTATAVMLLARDGRLRYDDRVADLLPGFPAYARDVRVRHLLTHTSGLRDYEDFVPDSQTTQLHDRDVLAILQRAERLDFAPGAAYHYSNSGYAVLALLVEAVSGQPFARFLHDRIFVPLGMEGTVAYEAGVSTVPRRAFGHSGDAASPAGFRRTDQSSTSAVLGDGGVYSSVHDLARWDRALDAGGPAGAAELHEAWTAAALADGTTRTRYGFGWFVDPDSLAPPGRPNAIRLFHHGETRGFTNAILKYPARRLTVVLLTNRTGGAPSAMVERIAGVEGLR
ncbi:MAG TPA: serine hydrolase domain-containing protein [Gemmatimonadaceae bacterium]|nr:serine hydrolase domain-containing protein [Gemmatimonadaceae bacterium]